MLTPSQCRAARALIGWLQSQLAEASGVSVSTIGDFETKRRSPPAAKLQALEAALERAGVVFIPENGGGAGVRLKFTRREVKAIDTLENEGGPAREDDV